MLLWRAGVPISAPIRAINRLQSHITRQHPNRMWNSGGPYQSYSVQQSQPQARRASGSGGEYGRAGAPSRAREDSRMRHEWSHYTVYPDAPAQQQEYHQPEVQTYQRSTRDHPEPHQHTTLRHDAVRFQPLQQARPVPSSYASSWDTQAPYPDYHPYRDQQQQQQQQRHQLQQQQWQRELKTAYTVPRLLRRSSTEHWVAGYHTSSHGSAMYRGREYERAHNSGRGGTSGWDSPTPAREARAASPPRSTSHTPAPYQRRKKIPRSLPPPIPTEAYLNLSLNPSHPLVPSTTRVNPLLVLDLNNTWLFRPRRSMTASQNPVPRDYLQSFLQYLTFRPPTSSRATNNRSEKEHRERMRWDLIVYSSARRENVHRMCVAIGLVPAKLDLSQPRSSTSPGTERLSSPRPEEGVGPGFPLKLIWSREMMGLTEREFNEDVETVKDLGKMWDMLSDTVEWGPANTVLLDDEVAKCVGRFSQSRPTTLSTDTLP